MKEDTRQSRRNFTPPLVTFDPLNSFGLTFGATHLSFQAFANKCSADVSCSGDKKCAKTYPLPKKVSFQHSFRNLV